MESADLCHCQIIVFLVIGWWYSSPFVELVWILRTTALVRKHRKQCTCGWGCTVGGMGHTTVDVQRLALSLGAPAAAQACHPVFPRQNGKGVCWHAECIGLGRQRTRAHRFEHGADEASQKQRWRRTVEKKLVYEKYSNVPSTPPPS